MYPEYAEINGIQYKIDTSWKNALECFKIIEDENITDQERCLAIIYKIFDFIPESDINLFLEKANIFLSCGETQEQQRSKKRDMDLIQDQKWIIPSFMSDYHIDLSKEDMHWWRYINLIQGLTSNSALSNVREIRNYDVANIKDQKEKNKIINMKKQVELKERKKTNEISFEKKKNIDSFYELTGIKRKE
jgi:hypothetical protein